MSYGCDDFFKPQNTLRQLLNIPNDPAKEINEVMYKINCAGERDGERL